jgi:co-chaperonin GroES (HSP10)
VLKPLNNHLLIEVIDENGGMQLAGQGEVSQQKGIILSYDYTPVHVTASSFGNLSEPGDAEAGWLIDSIGKKVMWAQYADSGQTFSQDNKTYALVPWWRVVAIEESEV